jgi:hypothetical protein
VVAVLLAGALGAAALPFACGGVGLGILSLGISLIFTGSSPGWALRDPAATHVPGVPEPNIDLNAGGGTNVVDRLIFLGGDLNSPVAVDGVATAIGAPAGLDFTLSLYRADDTRGLAIGATPITGTSIAIGTSATPFHATLAFPKPPTATAFPGDIAMLTLAVSSGEVILDTTQTRVRSSIFLNRVVVMQPFSIPRGNFAADELAESPPPGAASLVVPAGSTVTATFQIAAIAQPTYDTSGTSTGQTTTPTALTYHYEGVPQFSLVASATTTASFALDLVRLNPNGLPIATLASAGPIAAGASAARVAGAFTTPAPFFEVSTLNTGSAEPARLGLQISNAGPGDLTILFDPTGANPSHVDLPGPSVLVNFPSAAGVEVSQPNPALR